MSIPPDNAKPQPEPKKITIKRPAKEECRESSASSDPAAGTSGGAEGTANANFDIHKAEKKAVVYVEIGDNLMAVLDKAIQRTFDQRQSITNLMRAMGVDIKSMVSETVKMEAETKRKPMKKG